MKRGSRIPAVRASAVGKNRTPSWGKKPHTVLGEDMARESCAASRLALLARLAREALMTFLFPTLYGPSARYQPEKHYMRGAGPKCRAKTRSNRRPANDA